MLSDGASAATTTNSFRRVHDGVHLRLLDLVVVLDPVLPNLLREIARPAAIPDAADVVAGNDLAEARRLHMTDFDEAGVEQQDVWRMESDALCRALPFNGLDGTTGVTVLVDIEAELWKKR